MLRLSLMKAMGGPLYFNGQLVASFSQFMKTSPRTFRKCSLPTYFHDAQMLAVAGPYGIHVIPDKSEVKKKSFTEISAEMT